MLKTSDKANIAFKAGLFIVFTLSLLIFSILWIRFFSLVPDKTIKVRFEELDPLSKGVPVYYNGVNIGKTMEADFSEDHRHTIVKALIYRKDLKLPRNVQAEVRTTGITGQNYLEIVFPDNPSPEYLEDGDTIYGRLSAAQKLQKTLSGMIERGEFEKLISRIDTSAENISLASKKMVVLFGHADEILVSNRDNIRTFTNQAAMGATSFRETAMSLKSFTTSPELQADIRATASYIPKSSVTLNTITGNINKFTNNINKITDDLDKVIGNYQFQQGLVKTSCNLGYFTERLNGGDLDCLIKKTFGNTNRTLNRYDCIGESFSEMMNERFLIPKLIFGKPGNKFQKCTDLRCIEEQLYNKYPYNPPYCCPNE